jgi:tetratricopeptide (TPR) repeat protein
MNSDRLTEIANEIADYKRQKRFLECIKKMELYAREEKDASARTIFLTAQATCAMQMGDLPTAEAAIAKIDRSSLTPAERIYVHQVLASILQEQGRLLEADAILSSSLQEPELRREEHREAFHEMLARRGFILAHLNQCDTALRFFDDSLAVQEQGDLIERIRLYQGYCLQAVGRLEEAEKYLRMDVGKGSQDLAADIFYRLGAVLLQKGDYDAAIASFKDAERSLPRGQISLSDILMALSEAYGQIGQIVLAEQCRRRAETCSTIQ